MPTMNTFDAIFFCAYGSTCVLTFQIRMLRFWPARGSSSSCAFPSPTSFRTERRRRGQICGPLENAQDRKKSAALPRVWYQGGGATCSVVPVRACARVAITKIDRTGTTGRAQSKRPTSPADHRHTARGQLMEQSDLASLRSNKQGGAKKIGEKSGDHGQRVRQSFRHLRPTQPVC